MTTLDSTQTISVAPIHPFEKCGLGRAPFRCVGFYESKYQAIPGDPSCPVQPGSSCDYCGNGIMNVFVIKSCDGKQFKVGCDCVAQTAKACAKTNLERNARALTSAINKIKTDAANTRKDAVIAAAIERFEAHAADLDRNVEIFGRQRNAAEYIRWMFSNAGRSGKLATAKFLSKLLGH